MSIVRFLLEGCLELGLVATMSLIKIDGNNNFSYNHFLAILQLVVLIIAPVYLIIAALKVRKSQAKDFDEKKAEEVKIKYGKLFDNQDHDKTSVLMFNTVFIVRRLFLVATLTLLVMAPTLQISAYLLATFLSMHYLVNTSPYNNRMMNATEKVNEILITLVAYHLFCFTDYVSDLQV